MTDPGRVSLSLNEMADVLDKEVDNASAYVRKLIKEDQQYKNSEEHRDFKIEKLEGEIEELRKEAHNRFEEGLNKLAQAEELEEQLERIKGNELLPQDRKAVEEYLEEMDGTGGGYLNRAHYHVKDCADKARMGKNELIEEGVECADILPNLDSQIHRIKQNGGKITEENLRKRGFEAGVHNYRLDLERVCELAQIRDEALPEDFDGPPETKDTSTSELRSVR